MTNKTRVAILFGGRSSEHSVSCVTAASILKAIDRTRFDVVTIGITQQGSFILVPEKDINFSLQDEPMRTLEDNGTRVLWPDKAGSKEFRFFDSDGTLVSLGEIDVIFPALHGPWGEDGTLQGLMELVSIPYVGNGVLASSVCMDKHVSKVLFQSAGIKVAPWNLLTQAEYKSGADFTSVIEGLEFPIFVKPARAGSSVGVSRITTIDELPKALEVAFEEDDMVLLETGVSGREVEIAVLQSRDGDVPRVSAVIGEIVFSGKEFYDFEAKYLGSDGIQIKLPAEVSTSEYQSIHDAAIKAFVVAQCSGLARVDFFLTDTGPVLNEINTLPGFTPISMYPQLWEKSGLEYTDLITELIEMANDKNQ